MEGVVSSSLDCCNVPRKIDEVCEWVLKSRQVVASSLSVALWGIWKIRNKACFDNICHVDPNGVIV
jgi:hypothetical protein